MSSKKELVKYMQDTLLLKQVTNENLKSDFYCVDRRLKQDVFILTVEGLGVVGFNSKSIASY